MLAAAVSGVRTFVPRSTSDSQQLQLLSIKLTSVGQFALLERILGWPGRRSEPSLQLEQVNITNKVRRRDGLFFFD